MISLLLFCMILPIAGCKSETQYQLQSKIDDLQSRIERLYDRMAEMDDKSLESEAAIEDLNDRLAEKDDQIRERDTVIEDLNDRIKERDNRIEALKKRLLDMQNFVLTISADKQAYGKYEEIYIDIALENRSGEDLEIAYYFLFIPESPTGNFSIGEIPPVTKKKLFKNGETIHETTRSVSGCFPVGQHELKFKAIFYLAWEMTEFGWEETDLDVIVWSNTIEISIIES